MVEFGRAYQTRLVLNTYEREPGKRSYFCDKRNELVKQHVDSFSENNFREWIACLRKCKTPHFPFVSHFSRAEIETVIAPSLVFQESRQLEIRNRCRGYVCFVPGTFLLEFNTTHHLPAISPPIYSNRKVNEQNMANRRQQRRVLFKEESRQKENSSIDCEWEVSLIAFGVWNWANNLPSTFSSGERWIDAR